MVILVTFLLGIANFAMHKAVLVRFSALYEPLQGAPAAIGGRISLVAEFAVLLVALALVANGYQGWGWAYLGYSLFNGAAAWFILRRRA